MTFLFTYNLRDIFLLTYNLREIFLLTYNLGDIFLNLTFSWWDRPMFPALNSMRRRTTLSSSHSLHSYDDDEGEHKEQDAGGGDGDHNHETWQTDHPLGTRDRYRH